MRHRHHCWAAVISIGIAIAASAWADALPPVEGNSREQVYVIPKGTFERRMAGENLDILPSEIRLTLGIKDILVLKNEDDVPQLFGPVLIMPGQSFRLPFSRASRYQFACSLHVNGTLDVVVEPMPEAARQPLLRQAAGTETSGGRQ
jgi:hypothetical protein